MSLYFVGMWLSKSAFVVLFDRVDNLALFALSYVVMAGTGAFSAPFVGRLIDRFGAHTCLPGGAILYAMALLTRAVPEQPVLVISGACLAALGAATVLVAVRPVTTRIASIPGEPGTEGVIALRTSVDDIAVVGAGAMFAATVTTFGDGTSSFRWLALAAAAIVGCAGFVSIGFARDPRMADAEKETNNGSGDLEQSDDQTAPVEVMKRAVHWTLVASAAVSAVYVSFVIPTLPLLAEHRGIPTRWVGFTFAVIGIGKFVSTIVYATLAPVQSSRLVRFVVAEVLAGLISIVAAFVFGAPFFLVLLVRGGVVAIGIVAEEALQLALIPQNKLGKVFGQIQGAYLVGDMIGGSIAPQLVDRGLVSELFVASGVLAISNGLASGAVISRSQTKPLRRAL